MKKYLIFAIILILSLSLFACGETKTPENDTPTTEATTTQKAPKTERAPEVVVNMAEVPEAATPNERFADHPALALWDDVSLIPSYAEFENIPCFVPYLSEGDGGLIILVQGTTDDGAYYENEGAPVAEYLNSLGYDVLICKYRPTDAYTAAEDIRRALALALYTASDFGVNSTKVALMAFGNGALASFITCCDYESMSAVDGIDTIPAKPAALLLINPDMKNENGPFANATHEKAPAQSLRLGIYYDAEVPYYNDVIDFAYKSKDEYRLLSAEVHSLEFPEEFELDGERAEAYAEFYSLIQNFLKSLKFS